MTRIGIGAFQWRAQYAFLVKGRGQGVMHGGEEPGMHTLIVRDEGYGTQEAIELLITRGGRAGDTHTHRPSRRRVVDSGSDAPPAGRVGRHGGSESVIFTLCGRGRAYRASGYAD